MRNFLLITCLLFMASSFAEEVRSLSNGACWLKNYKSNAQLASFNEGITYNIHRSNLEDVVVKLRANNVSPVDIKEIRPYVHCSAMGVSFVFTVQSATASYCLWSKFENDTFVFDSVDLASERGGLCDGVSANKLIVAPNNSIEVVLKYLEESGVEVTSHEKLYKDVYSLTLDVRDGEIFKIKKLLVDSKMARIVDLVSKQHPIGDSAYLDGLEFKQ